MPGIGPGCDIVWHSTMTITGMKRKGKTKLAEYIAKLAPRVFVFDPMGEYEEFKEVTLGNFEIPGRYLPRTDKPIELDSIAAKIWAEGNVLLIIDEAELYMPNSPLPPNTFKLISRGGHRRIGLMAVTRRVADLNKTVFSLSDNVFVFRLFSKNDVKYLGESGFPNIERVRILEPYHFLHWTSTGEFHEHRPITLL